MSKRIRLSDSPDEEKDTDWSKCFICQVDKDETLMSPRNTSDESKSGYTLLVRNIHEFRSINEMPIPIDIRRIDNGHGIESTLIANKAKYHHACRLLFSNSRLKRARKRKLTETEDESDSSRFTRKKTPDDLTKKPTAKCFLCEEESQLSELRAAMTMNLNNRLNRCARTLQDKELLAKLSTGDVIVQEFKYHPKCLTALYNRERKFLHDSERANEKDQATNAGEIAFA